MNLRKMQKIWKERQFSKIFGCISVLVLLFVLLEQLPLGELHYVQADYDEAIPFIPQFIWIYLAWFPYIIFSFFYFSGKDRAEFAALVRSLLFGWGVFLIVSALYPTAVDLRPETLGSGISSALCGFIYSVDTPTNVYPSMHVFITLCFSVAFWRRVRRGQSVPRWYEIVNPAMTVLVPLSAIFVKQHAVCDLLAAAVLTLAMYLVFYHLAQRSGERVRKKIFHKS